MIYEVYTTHRGGSRAAATSKIERFVIIVNGWKPLTIITKRSVLDVAAALNPPLKHISIYQTFTHIIQELVCKNIKP